MYSILYRVSNNIREIVYIFVERIFNLFVLNIIYLDLKQITLHYCSQFYEKIFVCTTQHIKLFMVICVYFKFFQWVS